MRIIYFVIFFITLIYLFGWSGLIPALAIFIALIFAIVVILDKTGIQERYEQKQRENENKGNNQFTDVFPPVE